MKEKVCVIIGGGKGMGAHKAFFHYIFTPSVCHRITRCRNMWSLFLYQEITKNGD